MLTKNEMKNLLILCTRNIHFTFNNEIYIQNDGEALGSPLGPILAGIFMVKLVRYTSYARYASSQIEATY